MKTFDVNESPPKKSKSGFFVSTWLAIWLAILLALTLAGVILATYFGKAATQCDQHSPYNETTSSTTTRSPTTTKSPPAEQINYRLSANLAPYLYELNIKPYVGPAEYYGDKSWTYEVTERIHFTCKSPTRQIIFHSNGHNISTNSLDLESESDHRGLEVNKIIRYDTVKEFVIINMYAYCETNATYSLTFNFSGVIAEELFGFYRSSYIDKDGKRKYLATTDLEPTGARNAFPCFDEPALKAKFKLTMWRHTKYYNVSLFNTRMIGSRNVTDIDGSIWSLDEFDETPIMSTYLVAFVVCDYSSVVTNSSRFNINVQVYAKPQSIGNGDGNYALKEAANIIDYYSAYFQIPYPLDKTTQIAIPDLNSGAMENWGLITYRESYLLYNEKTDTPLNKHVITLLLSHELAHQWFGNLVSPAWWNDLWLNEGFASFVEYIGLNATHPEWRDFDYFFVDKLEMQTEDSLESSHPISVVVNDPTEVNSLFDSISYEKGASIVRMMSAFLTDQTFKNGITSYLNQYAYGNAEQDNLWQSLTEQAYKDSKLDRSLTVKSIMDTWTLQKGYPVVTVNRDYSANKISLTQNWFLLNPLNKVKSDEYVKYRWYIPFTFTTKDKSKFDIDQPVTWLKPQDSLTQVDLSNQMSNTSWIVGNIQHSGFFRVNYDQLNWQLLINQLKSNPNAINSINRAVLIDDAFNLGKAELINQILFFDLISYLKDETDDIPFIPAQYGLNEVADLLADDYETYSLFKMYYINILKKKYNETGWNEVIDPHKLNLQLATNQVMCNYGYQPCVDTAKSLYNDWFKNNQDLKSSFKSTVISTAIKYGSDSDWWALYNRTFTITDNIEKLIFLRGLASTQNYQLLKLLLEKSQDSRLVRIQDQITVVIYVAENEISRRLGYDYLEENWNSIFTTYGGYAFTLSNAVTRITSGLTAKLDLIRVESFIARTPDLGVAQSAFNSAFETIATSVRWRETNLISLKKWFDERKSTF